MKLSQYAVQVSIYCIGLAQRRAETTCASHLVYIADLIKRFRRLKKQSIESLVDA